LSESGKHDNLVEITKYGNKTWNKCNEE
jgi:hypothetical protein